MVKIDRLTLYFTTRGGKNPRESWRFMSSFFFFLTAGACAGFLNGFLGSGGGIPLVFAFAKRGAQKSRYRLALRFSALFSVLSVLFCLQKQAARTLLLPALLLPSLLGGFLGSRLLRRIGRMALHRLFAILLCLTGAWLLLRGAIL